MEKFSKIFEKMAKKIHLFSKIFQKRYIELPILKVVLIAPVYLLMIKLTRINPGQSRASHIILKNRIENGTIRNNSRIPCSELNKRLNKIIEKL